MSISPASDILLDVARAADPGRASAAAERLRMLHATTAGGDDFAQAMALPAGSNAAVVRSLAVAPMRVAASASAPGGNAYKGLEAFFLQGVVETILPKGDSLFGGGTAGDVWRSMLAEQLAKEVGKSLDLGLDPQSRKPQARLASRNSGSVEP